MAKNKLDMDILKSVVAAGPNGTYGPENEAKAFVDAGFMEMNPNLRNADGLVAVRATQAGVDEVGGADDANKGFEVTKFGDDVLEEAKNRKRAGGTRTSKYPFDSLNEVGDGFFIPATEKMPEPAKSMSSAITNAQKRYAEETGKTETKPVYEKNEDGERVQVGEKEVPVMRNTREFKIVPRDGGAVIVRTL